MSFLGFFYFFSIFYASINGNLVQFMTNKLSGIRPVNSKYPAGYRIVRFCHYPAGLSGRILYPGTPTFVIVILLKKKMQTLVSVPLSDQSLSSAFFSFLLCFSFFLASSFIFDCHTGTIFSMYK
jgi:hypothetical protein